MIDDTPDSPKRVLGPVLIPHVEITLAVARLAQLIDGGTPREDTVIVAIAEGGLPFSGSLKRFLPSHRFSKVLMKSYKGTESTGEMFIDDSMMGDVEGKHVVLIDDIYDTGFTLSKAKEHMFNKGAASVSMVCLLDKKVEKAYGLDVSSGFRIPDLFVVGYGLDLDGEYRKLKTINTIEELN